MFDLDKIIDYYGTSDDFDNCSYILKDGRLLKYKKNKTDRTIEHFEVEKFFKLKKCDCEDVCGKPVCQHKSNCRYSIRNYFMMAGHIRCRSDVGMFHIVSGNVNWEILRNYIEHHIFYNNRCVFSDYQKVNFKNNIYLDIGCLKNITFESDNYLEKIRELKKFYE